MVTRTAAELVGAMDASQRDVENWVKRLNLSTTYHKPEHGLPRLFSRLNGLELAFVAALVRGGATPAKAAAYARLFVLDARYGRLGKKWKSWFVFARGNLDHAVGTNEIDVDNPEIKKLNATTLSCVNVKELIRRVDDLFSEAD